MNINKILEYALEREHEGKRFFTENAMRLQNAAAQSVAEAMVADLPVLRMAYLIERDFAEFYHMAAEKAEGQAKEILTMLSHWESGHERLFKKMHDQAFEKYADMPWGG